MQGRGRKKVRPFGRNRGWHFRRSFIAGCVTILVLIVAIIVASAAKASSRKKPAAPETPGVSADFVSEAQSAGLISTTTPDATVGAAQTTLPVAATAPVSAAATAPVSTTANPEDKVIYLTFDDGPTSNTTNILDVLDRYGIKATFFVIHSYDGCEQQIKEIYDRGHQIALHSYTHDYSIYRSMDTYFDDLNKISDLVYNATGYRSMLVRFPGGTSNTISRNYCDGIMSALAEELPKRGYQYFDWDWDSRDASANRVAIDDIVDHATEAIRYGTDGDHQVILLMHDAAIKTTTVQALPTIIEAYRSAGYRFDVLSLDSYAYHHNPHN